MRTLLTLAVLALGASAAAADEACGRCGKETYGTSISWENTPNDAARKARDEQKLVFILHVSGNFEDAAFT